MMGKERASIQNSILNFLYNTIPGRMMLRPLINPLFSKLGGIILSSRISSVFIKPFISFNNIDVSSCEQKKYTSFNDFFTRKLKTDALNINMDSNAVIAPCDGRLTVYPITEDGVFTVKNTQYSLNDLLKSKKLAKRYEGGYLWLYRLCVDDYHRYIYPVNGCKSNNKHIQGAFHTVNPLANDIYPIYKENTREYCLIKTSSIGTILQMEVGAMLVGKIKNMHYSEKTVKRGEEKGYFAFGGSTIIVITQKGRTIPDDFIMSESEKMIETKVSLGQVVGKGQ